MADEAASGPNYEQHVQPILREHCLACHSQDKAKGGLALDSYGAVMTGGGGGEVVYGRDLESSRLWLLINHEDEPKMPPSSPKLGDEKLATIRKWIEGGAIERLGDKPKPDNVSAFNFAPTNEPVGEGAMPPTHSLRQPVVVLTRPAAISAMACSPNAPLLAVGSQRQVFLYHTEQQKLLSVLPFLAGQVSCLEFSRDGSLLVVGGGRAASRGVVALYDIASGTLVSELGDELDSVLAASISPNLQRVALGGPTRIVKLFNVHDGVVVRQMKRHTDWIMAVAFSPDGQYLVSGDRQGGIWLWEADTGLEIQDFPGHKLAITSLSWRADSNVFASSSEDGSIRLWNVDQGKQVRSWTAHAGGALDVQCTSDGSLTSTGRDRKTKLWNGQGKEIRSFPVLDDIGLQVATTIDRKEESGARARQIFAGSWSGALRGWGATDAANVWSPSASPPTLDMRLDAATEHQVGLTARVSKEAARATRARHKQQAHAKAVTVSRVALDAAWKQIVGYRIDSLAKDEKDVSEEPITGVVPDALPDIRQLIANHRQKLATASTLAAEVKRRTKDWRNAESDLNAANARIAAAQAELERFRRHKQEIELQLQAAQKLAQAAEETCERIERERISIEKLVDSAKSVIANRVPVDAADDENGMEEPEDATDEDAQIGLRSSRDWATSILKRGKAELAECEVRVAKAARQRDNTRRELARLQNRIKLFRDAYLTNANH